MFAEQAGKLLKTKGRDFGCVTMLLVDSFLQVQDQDF